MIKTFLRNKIRRLPPQVPTAEEIHEAVSVLFVLLTRYGDTVISLVVIKEFIERYPDKKYLILCPEQMAPYVRALLPRVNLIAINKRNFLHMASVHLILKAGRYDIGFSPWSFGDDGYFFISYCKRFEHYKALTRSNDLNHYAKVRRYLKLPEKEWNSKGLALRTYYQRILICPQSTGLERTIEGHDLDDLIQILRKKYSGASLMVAAMDAVYFRAGCATLFLEKTAAASEQFIEQVKRSDLLVCADSGPLHIAAAFGKDTIAVFKSTEAEQVLNTNSRIHCEYIRKT